MCTKRSSSMACFLASALVTRWWARTASAIWFPAFIVGFSDRDGSWNTIAMSVPRRSEEHTSELQSHVNLVCRLLLDKKKKTIIKLRNLIVKRNTDDCT